MTVERMAQDPAFPHFEAVRQDMADVIDISAKRGVYLTLEQAYKSCYCNESRDQPSSGVPADLLRQRKLQPKPLMRGPSEL